MKRMMNTMQYNMDTKFEELPEILAATLRTNFEMN
jgi:hypothetical protein